MILGMPAVGFIVGLSHRAACLHVDQEKRGQTKINGVLCPGLATLYTFLSACQDGSLPHRWDGFRVTKHANLGSTACQVSFSGTSSPSLKRSPNDKAGRPEPVIVKRLHPEAKEENAPTHTSILVMLGLYY
ncbi:hypothetical protein HYDPIDRAFT_167370 [Hydnomerulius pinastri MD-312]|uniref:Uncharacterized protein n=1 Tax=Hydnomerulius pinastri MD-312 TaxID=994086 RepID=A0A0C9WFR4_9AGAM|nr:hypothetical protein HYDPIDRAFT_167370 [Hydnomerulius pinastri MD-312]